MCGIAGIIQRPGSASIVAPSLVPKLLATLAHRGPDDHGIGVFSEGKQQITRHWSSELITNQVIFLHTRLSILDLSERGWQPMSTPDGAHTVVFNGEIYNFQSIRFELETKGYTFRTQTDTEVLLYAYREWGSACVDRFIGMFAFAIYDIPRQKIFLARDSFGIKPLYYYSTENLFFFASTIEAILCLPQVPRTVDRQRLFEYLRFGYSDCGSTTLFHEIHQLPPASSMEVSVPTLTIESPTRYWNIDIRTEREISLEEAVHDVRETFIKSVELHLRSDVPLGIALSGGIDSSSVLCVTRKILGSTQEIHALSFIADDSRLNEERWIDTVCKDTGAYQHKVSIRSECLAEEIPKLIRSQGEPFVSTSILAQRKVFELARTIGIKVVLEGQGADEVLAGYHRYASSRLASLLKKRDIIGAAKLFISLKQRNSSDVLLSHLFRLGEYFGPTSMQTFFRSIIGKPLYPSFLTKKWIATLQDFQERVPTSDAMLRGELYKSLTEGGITRLLRYADRNAMASSVENRVPFLTPQLATLLLQLPESYLLSSSGVTKYVFRLAMKGIVPQSILDRSDKIGFETPEQQWLAGADQWVQSVLSSEYTRSLEIFDHEELLNYYRSSITRSQGSVDSQLWRCINLIEWLRLFEVNLE